MKLIKILFFVINLILIIFYIYPGSIFGCIFYQDCSIQPQLTKDFVISSNHFYTFLVISLYGFIVFYKNYKSFIIFYLLSLSVILEISHLIIPNRSFQFSDIFGNIAGVIFSFVIIKFIYAWRQK
jgi:hypothetical protein